eukprot:XP_011601461.1 PREDICTED: isoaspartyl peptidase/L-asparaginase isoform X1 [Takifugu rubripes]
MLPVVVVHGGAGHCPKERSESAKKGVCAAARAGYEVLRGGGSSMDAVVEAVTQLENNSLFNAGCGSVLNIKGDVEMDALVMDGQTLASGAVAAVRNIANPVQLSRLVMDKTSHVCLTAGGAQQFAESMGVPLVQQESLITDYARMRWRQNLAPEANPVECQMGKMGTVGAVAVDVHGNVASATSTGGILNKMEGRVGDTPCVVRVCARLWRLRRQQGGCGVNNRLWRSNHEGHSSKTHPVSHGARSVGRGSQRFSPGLHEVQSGRSRWGGDSGPSRSLGRSFLQRPDVLGCSSGRCSALRSVRGGTPDREHHHPTMT